MAKIGFDNEQYLKTQSEHIRKRISQFDNKLYLEFGGKLFDDYHAARVLPGFAADSKLQMLMQLADQAEIVMVVSIEDIVKNKIREDLGITYDDDVLRLITAFRDKGMYVGSVVLTRYTEHHAVTHFQKRLEANGVTATVRRSLGGDIDASCGQLRRKAMEEAKRKEAGAR